MTTVVVLEGVATIVPWLWAHHPVRLVAELLIAGRELLAAAAVFVLLCGLVITTIARIARALDPEERP